MDTWATLRCPSDIRNENVDTYNTKTKNGGHEDTRSKVVSFVEPQEQREPDIYGDDSESTEVELRDDISRIPPRKTALFRASSRGSGQSRADQALVTQHASDEGAQR